MYTGSENMPSWDMGGYGADGALVADGGNGAAFAPSRKVPRG